MHQDIYEQNWQKARSKAVEKGLKVVDYGWEQHVIIDEPNGVVYRYPRHDAAAAKLMDEVAVLRDVNQHNWPIKLPVLIEHNEIFNSYKYIPGEVLTEKRVAALGVEDLKRIGQKLGEFLALFHRLNFAIVLQKQTSHSTSLLEYYAERINNTSAIKFKEKAKTSLAELKNQAGKTMDVVVHGDLHGPNIVINQKSKELTGVIDLSEMEIGDPHHEFRKIFMSFPGSLEASIKSYMASGGQKLNKNTIILWAYTNEWANLCYFADTPENLTYQRAQKHLKSWGQL